MNNHSAKGKLFTFLQDAVSTILVLLVVYFAVTLGIERGKYAIIFLGLSYTLIILKNIRSGSFLRLHGNALMTAGICFIGLFLVATVYLYAEYVPLLSDRAGAYDPMDVIAGAAIFVPLFFILWSEGGTSLFIIICLFILYFLYGNLCPGIFEHSGFSIMRVVEETILGFEGVYGIVLLTISTWVAIFLVYAGIIQGFGTLETIVKGFTLIFSKRQIFIPQIPVVTSLIFGSFSGAATANVAGTGSFTISIMKRFGLSSKNAAAIESVASSGGQVMPPLMGATAFLMASFLGVTYLHIVVVGIMPAMLFYLTLSFSVYLRTARHIDVQSAVDLENISWAKKDWFELLPLIVSLAVLFIRLVLLVPMMKACIESISVFLVSQFIFEVLVYRGEKSFGAIFKGFFQELMAGIKKTAPGVASIGIIGAGMGLIVRVLTVTGLGPKLSSEMVDLSMGSLPFLLVLTMALCIVFGMAVSTIAVYILTTFVVAPAFGDMDIPLISTHFMIFYLGNMSFITPPVAPAALVASAIAGSRFMPTAWTAVSLGLPLFLIGVTFVYHPEILVWSWYTPLTMLIVSVGLGGTATALHLPMKNGWKSVFERGAMLVVSFITMFSVDRTISLVCALLLVAWVFIKIRKVQCDLIIREPLDTSIPEQG